MRKKLLIFHSALAPYRIDFFNSLSKNFDCTIIFLSRNNRNQHFKQDELLSISHFRYEFMDRKIVIRNRDLNIGYLHYILKYTPDIVIGGEYGLPLIMPFMYRYFFKKKYKLYTICDDSLKIAQNSTGLRKYLRDFLVPKIDGLILISSEVAKWYNSHFKLENKPIIFPIIRNEEQYRNQLKECINLSNEYIKNHSLEDKTVILFVGRLNKVKNINSLLRAFESIASDSHRLVIIGDGPEEKNLSTLKESLQNKDFITFTGRFEGKQLIAWYNIADIFVLPSIHEPFGAVVNEALAAGCYVLCSDTAGAACLVNNENGSIFNPNNKAELKKELLSAVSKITKPKPAFINEIKPSKMAITFSEYMQPLIKQLNT